MSQAAMMGSKDALFEGLLQLADEGVVVHDESGRIVFCNPAAERILGVSAEAILGSDGHSFESGTIHEDGSPFPVAQHPSMVTLRTGKPCSKIVMGLTRKPPAPCVWVSINAAVVPASAGRRAMVFAVFTDITAHVETSRQLREMAASLQQTNSALATTEALMRSLLRAIPDHVWLKDPDGVYMFCNSALAKTFKSSEAEVIGKTDYDFSERAQAELFREQDREVARGEKSLVIEETVSFLNGSATAALETVKAPLRDDAGRLVGILGISRDITERRELEEKLRRSNLELKKLAEELQSLARTDSLTGLPNRRAFEEAIGRDFRRFKRVGTKTSLLMIDIDHFKQVNDQYGHNAGDAALASVAAAFRANCRAVDTAARLGGEEFALLLPGTAVKQAVAIAERLRDQVEKTEMTFGQVHFGITVSIGVSTFRPEDAGWQDAVNRADAALYAAKEMSRNRVCEGDDPAA